MISKDPFVSTEHPILFSSDMVRSNIAGRKTQTRRVLTPRNSKCNTLLTGDGQGWHSFDFNDVVIDGKNCPEQYLKVSVPVDGTRHRIFPRWSVGDKLWVRETWQHVGRADVSNVKYIYRADKPDNIQKIIPWKPSIFMPREAARIILELTRIRVERVQQISEADAIAEGVKRMYGSTSKIYNNYLYADGVCDNAIESYCSLWEKINGKGINKWILDPWVWVYEYKIIEKP